MTIETTRTALLSALSAVVHACDPKSSLSVLDGVLVEPCEGGVSLRCSNLVVNASAALHCGKATESFVVAAHMFRKVVDAMPDGPVSIASKDGRITIRGGTSCARLPVRAAGDFPRGPEAPKTVTKLAAGALRKLLQNTRHATLGDPNLPVRDGTYLKADGETVSASATDGNCGAKAWAKRDPGPAFEAFIPSVGVAAMLRAIDDVEDGDLVDVAVNGACLTCCGTSVLLYSERPMVVDNAIRNAKGRHAIRVNRAGFLAAVRRAVITAQDAKVRLCCKPGEIRIVSESPTGDTETTLPAEAEDVTITCAASYLLNQVERVPEDELTIEIKSTDGCAPLLFQTEGYAGVMGPMVSGHGK